jgi:hypothetical protein
MNKSKTFNGKPYRLDSEFNTKSEAEKRTKFKKNRGILARTVRVVKYAVYTHNDYGVMD